MALINEQLIERVRKHLEGYQTSPSTDLLHMCLDKLEENQEVITRGEKALNEALGDKHASK